MLKQYQEVRLNMERLVEKLRGETVILHHGQEGVIVEIHVIPGLPIGYSVEFFDKNLDTIAIATLEEKYLTPSDPPPPKTTRAIA